ncbi:hypothetical protein HQN64_07480 [Enterobacteriaceae bacterium BIT-l23]|uniref:YicS family protein n=1 Tax=Jejubacter sp. L23 TaxID=3092086 RepID=UPI001585693E|nr:hypothetical protein [Enterobacteriaceae bacterium BIT-l23]
MKSLKFFLLGATLFVPAIALAENPFAGLQFQQQRAQIVKEMRAKCGVSLEQSDTEWQNRLLGMEGNKENIQQATQAMQRKNQQQYDAAIKRIKCPE